MKYLGLEKGKQSRLELRQKQRKKIRRQRLTLLFSVVFVICVSPFIFLYAQGKTSPGVEASTNQLYEEATSKEQDSSATTLAQSSINTISSPSQTLKTSPLAGKTIVIDPGHATNPDPDFEPIGPGSSETKVKDPGGTSGVSTGVREPVVTLQIALYLKKILVEQGASVLMTRDSEYFYGGNRERAEIANRVNANLFIRIHCDGSGDSSNHGSSTLYPALISGWTDDIYVQSKRAAQAVQSSMVRNIGVQDNGIVERSDMTGFNWADVPAILVETGFMTNPEEDVKLNDPEYQRQIAQALFLGIKDYLNG